MSQTLPATPLLKRVALGVFVVGNVLAFVTVGTVGITQGIYVLNVQAKAADWNATTGDLLEAAYVPYQAPHVRYSYVVEGSIHTSTKFAPAQDALTGMTAKRLIAQVKRDADNGCLKVYVDPHDPSSSALYVGRVEGIANLIAGLIGLGLASAILFVIWRASRAGLQRPSG